jgi:CRP/FNR family transcriptional regulator, cyclic AMP receptor protein
MTPLGDTATIAIRGPGEHFGEMALVGGVRRSATVLALEESETFSIYHADFERVRRQYVGVGDVLTRFLVNEVRMLNERLLEALYVPVEKRVRRRLLELAEMFPDAEGSPVITLTQELIAGLAGAARPTVNKVLREEEKRGAIELARGRTRILDQEGLRKRAR